MRSTNIGRPDLNLLVVFDAIRQSGQVTLAAKALSLSQPAVSHALNRLRDIVSDPLFVRTQNGLVMTPRAHAMAPTVSRMLEMASEALSAGIFQASDAETVFTLGVSEYSIEVLLPPILRSLRVKAPKARLESELLGADILERLESGKLDCAFWGAKPPPLPFHFSNLYTEHFVGFVCKKHPLANSATQRELSLDEFLAFPHAIVRLSNTGASPLDLALEKLGRVRQVVLGSPSFAGNLSALSGTDLVFSVPSRFARLANQHDLVGFRLPVEVPEFNYSLIWHSRMNHDEAFNWLKGEIHAVSSLL